VGDLSQQHSSNHNTSSTDTGKGKDKVIATATVNHPASKNKNNSNNTTSKFKNKSKQRRSRNSNKSRSVNDSQETSNNPTAAASVNATANVITAQPDAKEDANAVIVPQQQQQKESETNIKKDAGHKNKYKSKKYKKKNDTKHTANQGLEAAESEPDMQSKSKSNANTQSNKGKKKKKSEHWKQKKQQLKEQQQQQNTSDSIDVHLKQNEESGGVVNANADKAGPKCNEKDSKSTDVNMNAADKPLDKPQEPQPQQEKSKLIIDLNAINATSNHSNTILHDKDKPNTNTKPSKKKKKKNKKHKDKTSNKQKPKQTLKKLKQRLTSELMRTLQTHSPSTLRSILLDPAYTDPILDPTTSNNKLYLETNTIEHLSRALLTAALFDLATLLLTHYCPPNKLKLRQSEGILLCLPQNIRSASPYSILEYLSVLGNCTYFTNDAVRQYWCRVVRGICLEFIEEAITCRDRLCSSPVRLLQQLNMVLYPVVLVPHKTKALVYTTVVSGNYPQQQQQESGQRGWVSGDAIGILPFADGAVVNAAALDQYLIEGTILSVSTKYGRGEGEESCRYVQFKVNQKIPEEWIEEQMEVRVDKLANRMGFIRLLSAVCTICAPAPAIAAGSSAVEQHENELISPELVRILTSPPSSSIAKLCSDPPKAVNPIALSFKPEDTHSRLNPSQRAAVLGALHRTLTLIQGPPGTGKTMVAIQILHHLTTLSHKPILAVSDSNIAVDNLVSGCADLGVGVVRLGRPESVRGDLLRFCVDEIGWGKKLAVLRNAQVICTTCIGAGTDLLDSIAMDYCLVDEATQCTEPAILIPLSRRCIRQAILVGDHCQLPPTVLSRLACDSKVIQGMSLSIPLFTRLTIQHGIDPFMLDTQYRMHPAIAQFPSDLFYAGKLINGVCSSQRRPLPGFPWPRAEFPVAFVPIHSEEHTMNSTDHSKYNEAEAEACVHAVRALLGGGQCSCADIAIVTPYAAQVRTIRRMLRQFTTQNTSAIEVSSTDGFQGREKEAVIFSAVRSNDLNQIGFTSDWRRINVSFTRARRALIVIGNDSTLRRGDTETWLPWLMWADAHGINMDRPGIIRGRYDAEQMRKVRANVTVKDMLIEECGEEMVCKSEDSADSPTGVDTLPSSLSAQDLRKDLHELANHDGHWDDSDSDSDEESSSDDESDTVINVSSRNTSTTNLIEKESEDIVIDAWDL